MQEQDLIYDWNLQDASFDWSACKVQLDDETLRDGLQCPSVTDPPLEDKLKILHLMVDLGIDGADIGLPGAGPRAYAHTLAIAKEIANQRLPIEPNAACRTVITDIDPVIDVSQKAGVKVDAAAFIGSSPIRVYAEDWTLDRMLRQTDEAVRYCYAHGIGVMFVTEDTTRSAPETIKALYLAAINAGAERICIADTVGHATPAGVRSLVKFVKREVIDACGAPVKLDWHGHRDRGFGLANTMAAIEAGVDRVHGTAIGVGERVGNAEMDLILLNLHLLGARSGGMSKLAEYVKTVSRATNVPIPPSYPFAGEDAFRTGTGVHAAAIIKARKKGHAWLADRVYSGVPAAELGLTQRIEISHVSGLSNVKCWLTDHGFDAEDEALCQRIFAYAKSASHVLKEEEVLALMKEVVV